MSNPARYKIRRVRGHVELSPVEIASAFDVTPATVYNWKRTGKLSDYTLRAIIAFASVYRKEIPHVPCCS